MNAQLALWSSLAYGALTVCANRSEPFAGWSRVTSLIALETALGGILVALCLKYLDAVIKNFPTAISVVIVTIGSVAFLDGPATFPCAVGALLVALSIVGYTAPEASREAADAQRDSQRDSQRDAQRDAQREDAQGRAAEGHADQRSDQGSTDSTSTSDNSDLELCASLEGAARSS